MSLSRLTLIAAAGTACLGLAACYPPEETANSATDSGATATTSATANQAAADASAQAAADAAGTSTPEVATEGGATAAPRMIEGRATGFETGDYNHVTIATEGGSAQSYFLGGGEPVAPFIVAHRDQRLTFTVVQRREMSESAGQEIDMAVVEDARTAMETAAQWYAREAATPAARERLEAATRAALNHQP